MVTTTTQKPLEQVTGEATQEGLRLARQAGDVYQKTMDDFIPNVAVSGGRQRVGEYTIGFAIEHAKPLYHLLGGELTWPSRSRAPTPTWKWSWPTPATGASCRACTSP